MPPPTTTSGRSTRSPPRLGCRGVPAAPRPRIRTDAHVSSLSDIPETIRSHDTLASPDYVDVFTAPASGTTERSPEAWARALLEETPAGRAAPALWRSLGLRLGPRASAEHVQGWKIAARGDDWIRLETASWFMTAHRIVHTDDHQLSLALFIRYDHPIASLVWMPVSALHRRAVPVMFRQA